MLDRDGTIIVERHYLSHPDAVELLPGAANGLRQLRRLGLGLVMITNQSAIGRGLFGTGTLQRIHERLAELLAGEGLQLDGIYWCPHRPEEDCPCRKPKTALVDRAGKELGFAPRHSFVIGDKICDIALGQGVGATTLLVRTGYGARVEAEERIQPDYVVGGLEEAAQRIERLLSVPRPVRMTQGSTG